MVEMSFWSFYYDISAETAYKRLLEWRECLRKEGLRTKMNVTFSAGIASFPVNGISKEEILVYADEALYCAKKSGRDKVIVYNDEGCFNE